MRLDFGLVLDHFDKDAGHSHCKTDEQSAECGFGIAELIRLHGKLCSHDANDAVKDTSDALHRDPALLRPNFVRPCRHVNFALKVFRSISIVRV